MPFHHADHQRPFDGLAYGHSVVDPLHRIDEHDINPRLPIAAGTLDGFIASGGGQRVGPADNQKVIVAAGARAHWSRRTISSTETSLMPAIWPHRFGDTWSSKWMAATPAC